MAITVVDEVMLREPRLLVPGLVPLGRVGIDVRNSFASRLINAQVNNQFFYKTAEVMPTLVSGTVYPALQASRVGSGLKFTGTPYLRVTNPAAIPYPLTMLVYLDPVDTADNNHFCGYGLEADGFAAITLRVTSGTYQCFERTTNANVNSGVSVVSGTIATVVATVDASKVCRIYVDGMYKAQGNFSSILSTQKDFVVGAYPWSGSGGNSKARTFMTMLFSTAFNDAQVLDLSRNPAQVFVPA